MRVIQIIDGYKKGDGVGNVVTSIEDFLNRHNIENCIIKRALIYADLDSGFFLSDDIIFYHLAVAMDPLLDGVHCIKVLIFHNITKPELLGTFDEEARIICSSGWYDLHKTKNIFDHAIVFSEYSKKTLINFGWNVEDIDVLPIQIRTDKLNCEPEERIINKYNDGKTNIIFTGRVYPNKKHEDIIASFAAYRDQYNPESRLILVGSIPSGDYYPSLINYTKQLNVFNGVIFTGHVSLKEYVSYYQISNVFLCMSEHEGFCIPLVEAMYFNIPIIAYDATATPNTLGGAGVLVNEKDFGNIAAIINELMTNAEFYDKTLESQRRRLLEISGINLEAEYERVLFSIIRTFRRMKKYEVYNVAKGMKHVETLFKSIDDGKKKTIVVYAAGSAGSRLYVRLKNTRDTVYICDSGRAGEYDYDLKCEILSPKVAISLFPDAYYVISIQSRRIAFDVSYELMDRGVKKNRILFYDRMKDQIM